VAARLFGEGGNDRLTSANGDDFLNGGVGADTLVGGGGRDTMDYSDRTGSVFVSADNAPGDGEAGENDNVADNIEVIVAGAGNDTLIGSSGADNTLNGGPGDDTLDGRGGADLLIGGDGFDRADYSGAGSVTVTLDGKPGDGQPGENDNVDTEGVVGSAQDDVLIGNAGPNSLVGGDGSDRILAGRGADAVDGGPGDDIIQTLDNAVDTVVCGDGEDGVVSDKKDVRTGCDYIKYRVLAASGTRIRLSKGAARIPVRCSPATALGCAGRATLLYKGRALATRTLKAAPGRRFVLVLKLSRRSQRLVKRRAPLVTSLVMRDRDASGVLTRTTQTIRLGA
jgi:Ca2+-binding RTX toxin-like protein